MYIKRASTPGPRARRLRARAFAQRNDRPIGVVGRTVIGARFLTGDLGCSTQRPSVCSFASSFTQVGLDASGSYGAAAFYGSLIVRSSSARACAFPASSIRLSVLRRSRIGPIA